MAYDAPSTKGRLHAMSDSTIYTIGTALNRARDNGVPVEILIEGHWLRGRVVAVDGYGVVLDAEDHQHSVLRIESVAAVTVRSSAPARTPIPAVAHPMPSPRFSYV